MKRLLSVLLVFVLCLSLLPAGIAADEGEEAPQTIDEELVSEMVVAVEDEAEAPEDQAKVADVESEQVPQGADPDEAEGETLDQDPAEEIATEIKENDSEKAVSPATDSERNTSILLNGIEDVMPIDGSPNLSYSLTGKQADDIVTVAIAQEGKTASDFGFTAAWCAYFVSWCGQKAASNLFSKSFANAKAMAVYMCNNNQGKLYYFTSAVKTSLDKNDSGTPNYNTGNYQSSDRNSFEPRKGDLICFNWKSSGGFYWDHIGIVTSVIGNTVYYADGNGGSGTTFTRKVRTGNSYQKTNSQIIAYIRPNYSGSNGNTNGTSSLAIGSDFDGPSGSKPVLTNYGLRGTITSNYNITKINAYVKNTDTNSIPSGFSYSKTWSSQTYNIRTDGLNNAFSFNSLPAGSYTYYVEATDSSGKTVSKSTTFTKGYKITFNANGGTGAPGAQWKLDGTNITLSSKKPTRTGYTFKGWSASAGGSAAYAAGATYKNDKDITLYDVWEQNMLRIKYNVNGGLLKSETYTVNSGGDIMEGGSEKISKWGYGYEANNGPINASTFGLSREGYTFVAWSLSKDGSSGLIDQNVKTTPEKLYPKLKDESATITLYAIWEENETTQPMLECDREEIIIYMEEEAAVEITVHYQGGELEIDSDAEWSLLEGEVIDEQDGSVTLSFRGVEEGYDTIRFALIDENTQKTIIDKEIPVEVIGRPWVGFRPEGLVLNMQGMIASTLFLQYGGDTRRGCGLTLMNSDPEVVSAEWNEDGNIDVCALSEGQAEITVQLVENETERIVYGMTCVVKVIGQELSKDVEFTAASVTASPGSTVTMAVRLTKNPGLAGLSIKAAYDESALTLTKMEFSPAFKALADLSAATVSTKTATFAAMSDTDYTGEILTLTFAVSDSAEPGEYEVTLTGTDLKNSEEQKLTAAVTNGKITVADHTPGDVTGDGAVDTADLIRLLKYVNGQSVTLAYSGDVTGDGAVDTADLIRLLKFVNGQNVTIY